MLHSQLSFSTIMNKSCWHFAKWKHNKYIPSTKTFNPTVRYKKSSKNFRTSTSPEDGRQSNKCRQLRENPDDSNCLQSLAKASIVDPHLHHSKRILGYDHPADGRQQQEDHGVRDEQQQQVPRRANDECRGSRGQAGGHFIGNGARIWKNQF